MRTTLDIDEYVLGAARVIAEQQSISLGRAISQMALRGLQAANQTPKGTGFPILPSNGTGHVITDELVARYRDDE